MTKEEALLYALLRAIEDSYNEHECEAKTTTGCGLCLLRRNVTWRTNEVNEHAAKGRYTE